MLSSRLVWFRSHFGHYEGKKCYSATARVRNLWVTGKTIHFVCSKTFRFYRYEINSKFRISLTAVSPSQSLYIPRTIIGVEVYSKSGIRIPGVVVICRCVCVCVCVCVLSYACLTTLSLRMFALSAHLKLGTIKIDTLGSWWCGLHTPHHTTPAVVM